MAGGVEDGSNDPRADWVHPFERRTGCTVTVRYATTIEELAGLMRQRGSFDGGLVSADVAGRLIRHGDVAPLPPSVLRATAGFPAQLRRPVFAIAGGRVYGVPFDYGPNLLLYRASAFRRPPRSWRTLWAPRARLAGRIAEYGSPIFFADAALYLRARDRSLGIRDPYELSPEQFDAVRSLVLRHRRAGTRAWTNWTDEIVAFAQRDVLAGVGRPIVMALAKSVTVRGVVPREGVTGFADAWMMTSRPQHPNCMRLWLEWTATATVQAQAARWNAAAPANPRACPALRGAVGPAADTVAYGRCGSAAFLRSLWLWRTPSADCGDGRRGCVDYPAWLSAWAAIRSETSS